ncbi:MAG: YqzL family protein [Clostridia bacterium]|nr:YqzL family protein [Clostridia bacterium]
MCYKDFFWQYFTATGQIGPYLIYKSLLNEEQEEDDSSYPFAVTNEE